MYQRYSKYNNVPNMGKRLIRSALNIQRYSFQLFSSTTTKQTYSLRTQKLPVMDRTQWRANTSSSRKFNEQGAPETPDRRQFQFCYLSNDKKKCTQMRCVMTSPDHRSGSQASTDNSKWSQAVSLPCVPKQSNTTSRSIDSCSRPKHRTCAIAKTTGTHHVMPQQLGVSNTVCTRKLWQGSVLQHQRAEKQYKPISQRDCTVKGICLPDQVWHFKHLLIHGSECAG